MGSNFRSKSLTMNVRLLSLLLILAGTTLLNAQTELLQSGPMVGYSEMREVMLWAQTNQSAKVEIAYREKGTEGAWRLTDPVTTVKSRAFTAHLIADQVEPGITYEYELRINGQKVERPYPTEFTTQALWQYRTEPPAFSFALGSCAYINEPEYDRPGRPYGGDYQIFESISAKDPDMMLWLGDNIYLREVDWYSTTGIHKRYTQFRSLPELQPLWGNVHHYAIWDDHDFGPNDSDRSFIHKDKTLKAFQLFWANPTYGLPDTEGGITSQFKWVDMDFFLLDDRYFRSPNHRKTGEVTLMGEDQLEWLIDALAHSRAPFKFVAIGGQVLNTAAVYENYSARHAEERAYLLRRIDEEDIKNVIFLTGDRHHTELSKLELDRGDQVIYDLTVSPLTSGAANPRETNGLRVPGTLVGGQRNFGVVDVTGPRTQRKLKITIYDSNGEELWTQEIEQQK
jgi:alkaline phosphatase D